MAQCSAGPCNPSSSLSLTGIEAWAAAAAAGHVGGFADPFEPLIADQGEQHAAGVLVLDEMRDEGEMDAGDVAEVLRPSASVPCHWIGWLMTSSARSELALIAVDPRLSVVREAACCSCQQQRMGGET